MSALDLFRFQASEKQLMRYTISMVAIFFLVVLTVPAEDLDGDGYDDVTGEWIGDSGTGDGSGTYDDGSSGMGMDSDGDGLSDDEESGSYFTDPNDSDTDDDGLNDYEEVFGVEITIEYEYVSYTDYQYDESTGEYTSVDVYETGTYTDFVTTDPNSADTDTDLLPDGYEVDNSLNPTINTDGFADDDIDGLSRGEEYLIGTDHTNPDSDSDGINDGAEVFQLSDPLDPNSPGTGTGPDDGTGTGPDDGTGTGPDDGTGTGPDDGTGTGPDDGSGTGPDDGTGTGPDDGTGTGPDDGTGTGPDDGTGTGPDDDDYTTNTESNPFVAGRWNQGDLDGDGLLDYWEFEHFGGKILWDADDDPDNDGLTNAQEYAEETDPTDPDSDGDQLIDGDEILLETSPHNPDSDEDGYEDGWEYNNGLDPANGDDIANDTDGNGIPDDYELFHALPDISEDGDGDGIRLGNFDPSGLPQDSTTGYTLTYFDDAAGTDVDEFHYFTHGEFSQGTYPDREDSDGDGLSDSEEQIPFFYTELIWDEDSGAEEALTTSGTTDPADWDTDDDGYSDGFELANGSNPVDPWSWPEIDYEIDTDGDGLSDAEEIWFGTDPNDSDSDDDGSSDFEEIYYHGTDANDGADFWLDTDGDGLSDDYEENVSGTDKSVADTDGDGFSDGQEILYDRTDANDSSHFWADNDNDGLRDDIEVFIGSYDSSKDSDSDGLSDLWEFYNGTDLLNYDDDDADGDGVPDVWEIVYFFDPEDDTDVHDDPDNDNLNSLQEFQNGTDPWLSDTDGDWLADDLEIKVYGTDPLNWDSDYDGSADGLELFWYATNPLDGDDVVVDSDEDLIPDDWETANGMDPNDGDDIYDDADGDGLVNGAEYWLGGDPQLADSDGDGVDDLGQYESGESISDQENFFDKVTNANGERDFDGDGLSDADEAGAGLNLYDGTDAGADNDSDGLTNAEEVALGTDHSLADSDGDGLSDYEEINTTGTSALVADSDSDGLNDKWEIDNGFSALIDTDGLDDSDNDGLSFAEELAAGTDPLDHDSDDDTMPDGWEVDNGLDPMNGDDGSSDITVAGTDPDGDELPNVTEYTLETDPQSADTDEDDLDDKWESENTGFDPLDPSDGLADEDEDGLTYGKERFYGTYDDQADPVIEPDTNADFDADGWPDGYEVQHGMNPTDPSDGGGDEDGDGLLDGQEYVYGTDPSEPDTDGDGLDDKWEIDNGYDPNVDSTHLDFDGDGLTDGEELDNPNLDFTNPDTDGDLLSDGYEDKWGFDPTVAEDHFTLDADGDGVSNYEEFLLGTNPAPVDTDGDGMTDSMELFWGYDPEVAESKDEDGDGMDDWWEIWYLGSTWKSDGTTSTDSDQLTDLEEFQLDTDPNSSDTDNDGLPDDVEVNESAGTMEVEEYTTELVEIGGDYDEGYNWVPIYEEQTTTTTSIQDIYTDPTKADTDGDLLPDGHEINYDADTGALSMTDMNPVDPTDGNSDTDADWLTRGEEYVLGTTWSAQDTDFDGFHDGLEILLGTDPLDPNDPGTENNETDPEYTDSQGKSAMQLALSLRDSDGDGVNDATELANGTDPEAANSTLPNNGQDPCTNPELQDAGQLTTTLAELANKLSNGQNPAGGSLNNDLSDLTASLFSQLNQLQENDDSNNATIQVVLEAYLNNAIENAGLRDEHGQVDSSIAQHLFDSLLSSDGSGGLQADTLNGIGANVISDAFTNVFNIAVSPSI